MGFNSGFKGLKTKRMCYVQGLGAYRAVNSLHLVYKNQCVNIV